MAVGNLPMSLEEMMLGLCSLSNSAQEMMGTVSFGLSNDAQDMRNWTNRYLSNQQQQSLGLFGQMQQMQGLGLTQQEQLHQPWSVRLPMQPILQSSIPLSPGWLAIGGPDPRETAARPTLWQRFVAWAKRPSRKPFLRTERRFLGWRFYR